MSSFLVIGMGRFGSSVATELSRLENDVLVLDNREENVAKIMDQVTEALVGDAKDEAVLRSLGVEDFDCVIVAMAGVIEDSVLTTMMLKEMGAKSIVCKAKNARHAKILTQLGADRVVRPEYDMGIRVARSLSRLNVIDFLDISPDFGVMEVLTPKLWAGKSISKINPRQQHGTTIIAVHSGDSVNFSLDADTILSEGSILTLIGAKRDLDYISNLK